MNIIIDNCKIFKLDIEASHNILVKNTSIIIGELRYTRESLFKNNILHRNYAAVDFSEKGSNAGDRMMKALQIGIILGSLLLFFIVAFIGFSISIIGGFLPLLIFIVPLIFFVDIWVKKKFIKNLSQNKFENNWYDTLEDLTAFFSKKK